MIHDHDDRHDEARDGFRHDHQAVEAPQRMTILTMAAKTLDGSRAEAGNVVAIDRARGAIEKINARLLSLRGHCERHGEWPLHMMDGDVLRDVGECPVCVFEKSQRARWQTLFRGVQLRFAKASFETFEAPTLAMSDALDSARAYAGQAEHFIASGRPVDAVENGLMVNALMTGSPGTGKTHLAVACMRELASRGRACCYARADQVVEAMHYSQRRADGWRPQEGEGEPAISARDMAACDLLVIDELGRFPLNPAQQALLFRMIDSRYGALRSTILISNASSEDQLESMVTPAGLDRIRECAVVIVMNWRSHRSTAHIAHTTKGV